MALRLKIKVVPSSGKSCCILDKNQNLKCFVKAPAQDGKANKEIIKFFANLCNVTQREVDIITGLICKDKILLIKTDMTLEDILKRMNLETQKKLF